VCIVGSGAGGGVMAGELSERGPEAFVRAGEHEAGPDVPEGA